MSLFYHIYSFTFSAIFSSFSYFFFPMINVLEVSTASYISLKKKWLFMKNDEGNLLRL